VAPFVTSTDQANEMPVRPRLATSCVDQAAGESVSLPRRRALVSHVGHCLTHGGFELAFVDAGGGHEDLL
jgi:hypothetical protein